MSIFPVFYIYRVPNINEPCYNEGETNVQKSKSLLMMFNQCKSKDRSVEIRELIQHFDEQKIQLSDNYLL